MTSALSSGQLALLSAFLDDDDFDTLARDRRFQDYVISQKQTLRTLLVRGFRLLAGAAEGPFDAGSVAAPLERSVATTSEAAAVDGAPLTHAVRSPDVASAASGREPQGIEVQATSGEGADGADLEAGLDPTEVLSKVTAICAERTGYPLDLLEPGLDLEADLGIDTIKQMELVAAVRAAYAVPKVEGYSLKQTPTLAALRDFVMKHGLPRREA